MKFDSFEELMSHCYADTYPSSKDQCCDWASFKALFQPVWVVWCTLIINQKACSPVELLTSTVQIKYRLIRNYLFPPLQPPVRTLIKIFLGFSAKNFRVVALKGGHKNT